MILDSKNAREVQIPIDCDFENQRGEPWVAQKREVLRMRPIVQAGAALISPDFPTLNHPGSKGGYESSLASFLEVRVVR